MRNLPTELVESQSSIRIIEYDINTDSGGPGRWRGGVGQTLTVESLCDDGIIIVAGLDRMRFPTFGVAGGRPGAPMRAVLNRGRAGEKQLGKVHELYVRRGDTVTILMPGGGGFGDPLQRDPQAVLSDVLRGFVTAVAAERDYGVIIRESAVDLAASATYRAAHSHDAAPSAITFSRERLDWEEIFPDGLLRDLNRLLYALPKSVRQQTRRQLFEIAVPGILAHDRPPLAALVDDKQAASARLRDALVQFSRKSSVERAA
jgi:N-methylhydantoinase B